MKRRSESKEDRPVETNDTYRVVLLNRTKCSCMEKAIVFYV